MTRGARGALGAVTVALLVLLAGCSDDDADPEAFCDELGGLGDLPASLASLDPGDLEAAEAALSDLLDAAPAEVRDEVAELHDTVDALAATVATATGDPMEAAEQVLRDQGDRSAQVERAGRAVERYATDTCGVDLTGTTSTTAAPPPAAPPSSSDAG